MKRRLLLCLLLAGCLVRNKQQNCTCVISAYRICITAKRAVPLAPIPSTRPHGGVAISPQRVIPRQLPAGLTGWSRARSRPDCERLAYFGESANLRFQSLVVLPLDLKF